jgi:fatty acid desaturase
MIGILVASLVSGHVPTVLWPLVSVLIGCCFSGVVFLGHETLHGGVVHGQRTIRVLGWFCLLPFTLSPTLWTAWHNRVHHGHCGQAGKDPDMYPTLLEYQTQRAARVMADHFGLGRRRVLSLLSLLFGFTGQSQQMLWKAREKGILSRKLHRRAIFETLLGIAFWAAIAGIVGLVPFLFVYAIPLVVTNSIVMMFIMTNHNLSPLTPNINDPLVNSLSVTLPRPLEWLTLDFGYHVEHHLFPAISTRHGRLVRAALLEHFPHRYQSMPLGSALSHLFVTARVYQDDTTLFDPRSGQRFPTLMPRSRANNQRRE